MEFYKVPHKIYKNNPYWFGHLGSDLDLVFNKNKNSLFESGDLKMWIALDKWNNISGRIAAFYSKIKGIKKGGFGFFESIEEFEVTKALLDTAFNWLKANGCNYAEGPINFGEKDRFWGLLTKGFETPGLYLENYNHPYYESYFKDFGLSVKDVINTYEVKLDNLPLERLKIISDRLLRNGEIEIVPFSFDNPDQGIKDIHEIYKMSFKESNRLKMISENDIRDLFKRAGPLMQDEMIWLAYFNKEPIAFLAFMKDLNQFTNKTSNKITLKGFGIAVKPKFRKKAVELALSYAFVRSLQKQSSPFAIYFTGINSNTDLMTSFMEKLNATISKQHKTFSINLINHNENKN